jgi:hypothetical protein
MRRQKVTSIVVAGLGLATTCLLGCGERTPSSIAPTGHELARGPLAPPAYQTRPQQSMLTIDPTPAPAPTTGEATSVDARLLVITADGTDPAYLATSGTWH